MVVKKADTELSKQIKKVGFAKSKNRMFSQQEMQDLENVINTMMETHSDLLDHSSNSPVLNNILGLNETFDSFIERLLSDDEVQAVLKDIAGENYKIWDVSPRISILEDQGLALHSDATGQMNLALLINKQKKSSGVTALIPYSHLLPRNKVSKLICKVMWRFKLIRPLLVPFNGDAGEFGFFINKTWHGRFPNKYKVSNKIILIGFFPVGGIFRPVYPNFQCNSSALNKMFSLEGVEEMSDGTVRVIPNGKTEVSYLMEIEKKSSTGVLSFFIFLLFFVKWFFYSVSLKLHRLFSADNK